MPGLRDGLSIVKQVQQQFGTQLCFVFRNFPLSDIHPYAKGGCRGLRRRQFSVVFGICADWLYANQQSWVPMVKTGCARPYEHWADTTEAGRRAASTMWMNAFSTTS